MRAPPGRAGGGTTATPGSDAARRLGGDPAAVDVEGRSPPTQPGWVDFGARAGGECARDRRYERSGRGPSGSACGQRRDELESGRHALFRPGSGAHRARPRDARDPPQLVPRADRAGAGPDGRRAARGLHGLPRPAQRRARPVQGRDPLPPGRGHRRGAGARGADDVEDGADGRSLRRREGRRPVRRGCDEPERAPAADASVHEHDQLRARRQPRHPGAGREHRRPDDGLDVRRVLGPLRLHAGDRHRQAGRARRSHRGATRPPAAAWSTVLPRRRATTTSISPARPSPCRDSATSAPGSRGSRPSLAAGWWRSRTCAAAWRDRRASTSRRCSPTCRSTARSWARRNDADHQRGAARAGRGRAGARGARPGDPRRERGPREGPDRGRGGQPSGHPGGRRPAPRARRRRDPGHPGQRAAASPSPTSSGS